MACLLFKTDLHNNLRKDLKLANKYDIIRTTIKYFFEMDYDEQFLRIKTDVAEYAKNYVIVDLVVGSQLYNDASVNFNYSLIDLIVLDKDTK